MDWYTLLRGIGIGLLLGMMTLIWLRFRHIYALRMLAGFALCLCGYLMAPLLYQQSWLFYPAVMLSDASVFMFLLLVQALFDDHQQPDRRSLWFGAIYLPLSYLSFLPKYLLGWEMEWLGAPVRIIMLVGAAYALYVVVRHWREDLVQARRRLRLTVCVISGCYVLGVTIVESLAHDVDIPRWVDTANSVGIAASVLLFIAAAALLGEEGLLPPPAGAPRSPAKQATSQARQLSPELAKLTHSMASDRAYQDMGLTIRHLSDRLGIAEHRLRKLINQELNFRNFNDFLNHYRLAEVASRLANPGDAQIPILTIAMDAGYRSMTTFNRAFRAEHGQTPTEFRNAHGPISEKS